MIKIYEFRFIVPEKMRANPKTTDSDSMPKPRPLSLICFLGIVIIFETKPINGVS